MKHFASILMLVFAIAPVVWAQQSNSNDVAAKEQSEAGKRLNEYIDEQKNAASSSPGGPAAPAQDPGGEIQPDAELFVILERLEKLDEPSRAKVLASFTEYLDYRISGYQHRREVFKWQLYSSKVTFYVVIFLVLAGVYFSGIQFHRSLGQKPAKLGTEKEVTQVVTTERNEVTEISASLQGIKVSSPVLGVLILVISLLFFYLYLRYVYPIQEIF